jgi:hypothetical protein
MSGFWPFGRKTLRASVWPGRAGTWAAAGDNIGKYVTPAPTPQQAFTRQVQAPIGLDGQIMGVIGASGGVTLRVGPAGVGSKWALDQAGISTSTGQADASTCAVYAGPQAIESFFVAQSYAGGGSSVGLPGLSLSPGEFVWAVWSGGVNGANATLKVTGVKTALAAVL